MLGPFSIVGLELERAHSLTQNNGMATFRSISHFLYPRLWIMMNLGVSKVPWPFDVSLNCEEDFPILRPVGRHCLRVS